MTLDRGVFQTHARRSRFAGMTVMATALALLLAACPGPPPKGQNRVIRDQPSAAEASERAVVIETLPRAVDPVDPAEKAEGLTAAGSGRYVVVESGDTLYSLARRHDVAVHSMIEANRLEPPYLLKIGQVLVVPDYPEVVVQPGDTVYRIARCEGVRMAAFLHLNEIKPPYVISPGQRLRLPARVMEPDCPDRSPGAIAIDGSEDSSRVAAPDAASGRIDPLEIASIEMPGRMARERDLTPPARAGSGFLWPVEGKVVSAFGPKQGNRRNNGINIGATEGAPVRAADNGVVIYAGNELRGYGNLVLVQHADDWTTAYAHNGAILVEAGDPVTRGQTIALVGSSGNVSTPQTHFELRRNAEAVDPLLHLTKDR